MRWRGIGQGLLQGENIEISNFYTRILLQGDSGGPLYMKQVTYSGRPISDDFEPVYLMGIVSFGSKKCGTGTPGVYTRVLDMLPWIMEKMNIKV